MAYKVDLTDIFNKKDVNKLICPFIDCTYTPREDMTNQVFRTFGYPELRRFVLKHVFLAHILKIMNYIENRPLSITASVFWETATFIEYYLVEDNRPYGKKYRYKLESWERTLYKLLGKRELSKKLMAMKLMFGK